ncbi:D-alanyl-D-alanine carboxypeptidase [Streptomyces sp. NPDC013172]|uniref:D-alanyl-D-alanine carboxypeptidase n=1 Tax=Streptomyces sp. NPDC013172 TaxID=3155009 RepID=UPI0033FB2636
MVRTAHGDVRSVEEASVAGESPDRSKQRESSAEPTSGSAGSVPEAPDPRLAVAAAKERAGGVDTATRVFSVRDPKAAGEDDTELREAVATWVRTPDEDPEGSEGSEAATGPAEGAERPQEGREAPEAPGAPEDATDTPEAKPEATAAPKGAAAPEDAKSAAPSATSPADGEDTKPADPEPGSGAQADTEPEEADAEDEFTSEAEPEAAKPAATTEPEDANPEPGARTDAEPEDAKPAATTEPEDARPARKPEAQPKAATEAASATPEDATPEAAGKPGTAPADAKPGTGVPTDAEPEDAKPQDQPKADVEPADAESEDRPKADADAAPEDTESQDRPKADAEPEDAKPEDRPKADAEPEDAKPEDQPKGDAESADAEAQEEAGGDTGAEGRSGGGGADNDGRGQGKKVVDQPTTTLKAPRVQQVDQPTTMLKLGGAPKPKTPEAETKADTETKAETEAERTSKFVALKSDIKPGSTPSAKPGAKPQATPDAKPESGPEGRPETASTTRTSVMPQVGPERTTQQPLPPKPPLDLLAELTNTPRPPETPVRTALRRVKIWTPLVILLLIVFAVVQTLRPLPQPTLDLTAKDTYTFDGSKVDIPWPADGQAALDVQGIGTFGSSGAQKPVPIASVAKVMTAYIILRDHPLKSGAAGPKIKIDQAAQDQANAGQESTVDVTAGDSITQREALESILIASANNIARLLARWDAGSEKSFVSKMNATAKKLGMTNTMYTDPSGLTNSTVSTAVDQVKLAKAAMASEPVFREVAAMMSYDDYKGVNHGNWNQLVGQNNVVGIKTGTTTSALGNLVFAAKKDVNGETRTVIGAVIRQPANASNDNSILKAALNAGDRLIRAAQGALRSATIYKKGDVVGYVDDRLGGRTPVVATKDVTAVGWSGLKVKLTFAADDVPHTAKAGTKVGTLTVGDGSGSAVQVPVALEKDLAEPGFAAKLTRLG